MKADNSDPRPYFESGILHKANNDFIQAEQMLRQAAELSPEDNNISRMLAAVVVLNLVHNRKPVSDSIDK